TSCIATQLPVHTSFSSRIHPPPRSTLFPYTTLFRSLRHHHHRGDRHPDDPRGRARDPVEPDDAGRFLHVRRLHRSRGPAAHQHRDRKSTRLNSSHVSISYAVFCLKKKINTIYVECLP